jgi:hypothetical protein
VIVPSPQLTERVILEAGDQLSVRAPCWKTVTTVNRAQAVAGVLPNEPVGGWMSLTTIAGTSTTVVLWAASWRVTVGR